MRRLWKLQTSIKLQLFYFQVYCEKAFILSLFDFCHSIFFWIRISGQDLDVIIDILLINFDFFLNVMKDICANGFIWKLIVRMKTNTYVLFLMVAEESAS